MLQSRKLASESTTKTQRKLDIYVAILDIRISLLIQSPGSTLQKTLDYFAMSQITRLQ